MGSQLHCRGSWASALSFAGLRASETLTLVYEVDSAGMDMRYCHSYNIFKISETSNPDFHRCCGV